MFSPYNGVWKRGEICKALNWEYDNFEKELIKLYVDEGLSSIEIVEYLDQSVPVEALFTPRSVQRILKAAGVIRPIGASFRLAAEKGRVKWVYKSDKIKKRSLLPRIRMEVLKRDGFKCVFCGATATTSILEIDHIKAKSQGGDDSLENLRVLCHECNIGKRIVEKEV